MFNCERCKKPITDDESRYLKIVCGAWQPERRFCTNCVEWFHTYFNRFMQNDMTLNEVIQQPPGNLRAIANQISIVHIPAIEKPIPMVLHCPECGERHIDENGWEIKIHYTHACQNCGLVWRPAIVPTIGVRFLPGFKNK